MDWTRPPKHQGQQTSPPPLYLTHPETPYCRTCGRVIGSRRTNNAVKSTEKVKFCSERCKRHKPTSDLDGKIEAILGRMLDGLGPCDERHEDGEKREESETRNPTETRKPHLATKKKPSKGDARIILHMSALETAVFGSRADPERHFGRKRNRAKRGVPDEGDWRSVDMQDDFVPGEHGTADGGDVLGVRIVDEVEDLNGAGDDVAHGDDLVKADDLTQLNEIPESVRKRREGQKRAEEREQVRQAARRAVVFGLEVLRDERNERFGKRSRKKDEKHSEEETTTTVRRKCEALMNGMVVEPSFAKGDWEIRWRDE